MSDVAGELYQNNRDMFERLFYKGMDYKRKLEKLSEGFTFKALKYKIILHQFNKKVYSGRDLVDYVLLNNKKIEKILQ